MEGGSHQMLFRWINFAILAGGLGYLIRKNAGPFFAARSQGIAGAIAEGKKLLGESNERARQIEQRLARLGQEVEELRASARREMAAELTRVEQATGPAVRKVFAQAEQEMAAAVKAARLELKAHVASLAVALAEQRLAGRVTPPVERGLVAAFLRNL